MINRVNSSRWFLFVVTLSIGLVATSHTKAVAAQPAQKPVVHALLVFDTDCGGNIAKAVKQDAELMSEAFSKLFVATGMQKQLKYTVLKGRDATAANVMQYYADLQSSPKDTLFFYYSGHGGWDTEGHFLAFTAGPKLNRCDLRGAIYFQKPRLAIMITDACATFVDKEVFGTVADRDTDLTQDLFFDSTGFVDVNSSQPGKVSSVSRGGGSYFTMGLNSVMKRKTTDVATSGKTAMWRDVMKLIDSEMPDTAKQRTYFFFDNEWPKHYWEKELVISNQSGKTVNVYVHSYALHADNKWEWRRPSTSWQFDSKDEATLLESPKGEYRVRGSHFLIAGYSTDGRSTWEKYKNKSIPSCDLRFGYASDRLEKFVFTLGQ